MSVLSQVRFQEVLIFWVENGAQFDHAGVAEVVKVTVVIQHISDTATHARREVAAHLAQHNDLATRHVFRAVVARALDDGDGTTVAHAEALSGDAANAYLTTGRAIQQRIANDDVVLSD